MKLPNAGLKYDPDVLNEWETKDVTFLLKKWEGGKKFLVQQT